MSATDTPGFPDDSSEGTPGAPAPVTDEDGELVGDQDPAATEVRPELGDVALLVAEVAELTGDLQRLQAEYTNYRRRVERDREQAREQAVAGTLTELLPVLDDIGRARQHDELAGGFLAVGEALEQAVAKLGLEQFGAVGDPFDPSIHEALTHIHSSDVTQTTAVEVFAPGYRLGERIVRPARVVVADPPPNPT